jgi:excisionase family DNA binding protein
MKTTNRKHRPPKTDSADPAVPSLTVKEVAVKIGFGADFVRDEIRKRKLAAYRLGWRVLVSPADLGAYLQRQRTAAFGEGVSIK